MVSVYSSSKHPVNGSRLNTEGRESIWQKIRKASCIFSCFKGNFNSEIRSPSSSHLHQEAPTIPEAYTIKLDEYLNSSHDGDKQAREFLVEDIKDVILGKTDKITLGLPVTELPSIISELKNLKYLGCSGEFFTSGELTKLPKLPAGLIELNCSDNQLEELPLFPRGLRKLNCSNNSLGYFPAFNTLEDSLEELDISGNHRTIKSCHSDISAKLRALNTLKALTIDINIVEGFSLYDKFAIFSKLDLRDAGIDINIPEIDDDISSLGEKSVASELSPEA